MAQLNALIPLDQIDTDPKQVLAIKRMDLVPLLDNPYRLNHYADQLIQAQAVLLNQISPELTHDLSRVISHLIDKLSKSDKVIKKKSFNRLQKWFGVDIEHDQTQLNYLHGLDALIEQADRLSQQLAVEIQKSQSRIQLLSAISIHSITFQSGYLKKSIVCKHYKPVMILPSRKCF